MESGIRHFPQQQSHNAGRGSESEMQRSAEKQQRDDVVHQIDLSDGKGNDARYGVLRET